MDVEPGIANALMLDPMASWSVVPVVVASLMTTTSSALGKTVNGLNVVKYVVLDLLRVAH